MRFKPMSTVKILVSATCIGLSCLAATGPALAKIDHQALLRDRLTEVRELLERRLAHRHMLTDQIETLSAELDQLHLQRKAAADALSEQIDQTRSYETELDRLVPRLLPRLDHLEELRKQGARTIADLAKIGRDKTVKAETKARFLSARTVFIDQMRKASTGVRLLRRTPNRLIGKQRDLDFQIPLLESAVDRLRTKQDWFQRRRDDAIRDMAALSVDIERLTAEEHRLARNLMARTLTATVGNDLDRRLDTGKAKVPAATIKSAATRRHSSGLTVTPTDKITGSPSARDQGLSAKETIGQSVTGKAVASAPANSVTKGTLPQRPVVSDRNIAALQAAPLDSVTARVGKGQIQLGNPLVPSIETISYSLLGVVRDAGTFSIGIPATPRQRVAAPDGGMVAFAGEFRDYGLLLIIEHDSEYHTLLWGFSSLDIEMGDPVQAGQIVGTAGLEQSPKLHVELRRNGEPISPEVWLAASNNGIEG